jgi:ABC-2 type transport system permease protein
MNKVFLIIRREYLTRVRKKSFIIMTILGPLIFGAFMIVPFWLTQVEDHEVKKIGIVELDEYNQPVPDSLLFFKNVIENKENLKFSYLSNIEFKDIERLLENTDYYGILILRQNLIKQKDGIVELYAKNQPSVGIETHITKSVQTFLFDNKLLLIRVPPETINALKTNVSLKTIKLEKGGFKEQKLVDVKRYVGYAAGFLVYFFIFFFGAQVMRGVIEEKTSRIIEVIITSVRPFQLMMGKIIGIALVGLTQFLVWVILTAGIFQYSSAHFLSKQIKEQYTQTEAPVNIFAENQNVRVPENNVNPEAKLSGVFGIVHDIDFLLILSTFLFYFIGGYLLYAAMFAAIGSAVDSETDTQQFMLPVTIPLVVSIIVMVNAITNPAGQLAYWFSIIPFTSPVVMMARIPFGVPKYELVLSMALLIAAFFLMTWMAGKIYRTGILMYGKKVNYKELLRWLWYKE